MSSFPEPRTICLALVFVISIIQLRVFTREITTEYLRYDVQEQPSHADTDVDLDADADADVDEYDYEYTDPSTYTVRKIQEEALEEAGIPLRFANDFKTFPYPLIPTSGYRFCLSLQKTTSSAPQGHRTIETAYMGDPGKLCKDCVWIDPRGSFHEQSKVACQSKTLECGDASSWYCGLLGFSTKTPLRVHPSVLKTWPVHLLKDFSYDGMKEVPTLESNHRLAFDRHTIPSTHPLLQSNYNIGKGEQGFNVFQWDCDTRADKRKPIPHGNMGDIFGSYLGKYLADLHHLEYYVHCTNSRTPLPYKVSVALVGSILRQATDNYNTAVLGIGSIADTSLDKVSKYKLGNLRVLGVRGPLTRDQFLEDHAINPSILGDPGIFLYPIFEELIEDIRKSTPAHQWEDLCFISHYVDIHIFRSRLSAYQNVTMNAEGDMEDIVKRLATCRHTVSSSLHGAIFSHSLGIPSLAIKVSDGLAGGEHKFYDYYYGVNVTTFRGRYQFSYDSPKSKAEWIDLIRDYPQPDFPIYPELKSSLLSTTFQRVFS